MEQSSAPDISLEHQQSTSNIIIIENLNVVSVRSVEADPVRSHIQCNMN